MTQPVFVNAANATANFSSTATVTLTTGSAADRGVWGIAFASQRSGGSYSTVTGVTIGGNAATLSTASTYAAGAIKATAFWLAGDANIPTTSASVVATFDDGLSKVGILVMSFSGCAASPFGTTITAQSGADNIPTFTLTSTTNAMVAAAAIALPNGTTPWTATSPATMATILEASNHSGPAFYRSGAAGSTTIAASKGGAAGGWVGFAVSIEGTAAPSDIGGNVTLDNIVAAGTLGSSASDLSGGVTLADAVAAGTLGLQPGTISLSLVNENNGPQGSITLPWLTFQRLTDAVQVLALASQSTNGAAALTVTNGALVQGTWYVVTGWHTDGTKAGVWVKQAA